MALALVCNRVVEARDLGACTIEGHARLPRALALALGEQSALLQDSRRLFRLSRRRLQLLTQPLALRLQCRGARRLAMHAGELRRR